MQMPDDLYLYGRVVSTEARWTWAEGADPAILIYVYRVRSQAKELPDRGELRPDRLLVSPMMTNRLPWSRGYFETIAHVPLDDSDVLPSTASLTRP